MPIAMKHEIAMMKKSYPAISEGGGGGGEVTIVVGVIVRLYSFIVPVRFTLI